jgi:hypothetical protein
MLGEENSTQNMSTNRHTQKCTHKKKGIITDGHRHSKAMKKVTMKRVLL